MTSLLHAVSRRTHDEVRVTKDVAAWLRQLRRDLELSQSRAARIAGVSRNTFSSWERERTTPTIVQRERLKTYEKNQRRAAGASAPARPPFAKAVAR